MTTNETSFFRDIHPFRALSDTILPELLLQRGREPVSYTQLDVYKRQA